MMHYTVAKMIVDIERVLQKRTIKYSHQEKKMKPKHKTSTTKFLKLHEKKVVCETC
ncbi:hypothetical protein ACLM5H_00645 [Fredinandcohnia humi]